MCVLPGRGMYRPVAGLCLSLCLVPLAIPVYVYMSQGVRFKVGWQVLGDLRGERMKVLLNIAVRQCNTHEAVHAGDLSSSPTAMLRMYIAIRYTPLKLTMDRIPRTQPKVSAYVQASGS
jgi:hypothetical protein